MDEDDVSQIEFSVVSDAEFVNHIKWWTIFFFVVYNNVWSEGKQFWLLLGYKAFLLFMDYSTLF